MRKINLTILASPIGHDVSKVYGRFREWMDETQAFNIATAGPYPFATCPIREFMLDSKAVANTDVFFILCSDEHWTDPEVRKALEAAVFNGAGILFSHGIHPCFSDWEAVERMAGLMWRDEASHGDYNYTRVHMTSPEHPITRALRILTPRTSSSADCQTPTMCVWKYWQPLFRITICFPGTVITAPAGMSRSLR